MFIFRAHLVAWMLGMKQQYDAGLKNSFRLHCNYGPVTVIEGYQMGQARVI
jgi:hypothetical protein